MKTLFYGVLVTFAFCSPTNAGPILFDFNSGPQYSPLPLNLTVDGVTAHFSATGQGYSIQNIAQVIGVLPTGFSGLGLSPNSVYQSDLLVSFPNEVMTGFSIMVAPQELSTDTTATLSVTAYRNGNLVGSSISQGVEPFLWPSSTLSFNSQNGFDSVVIHYLLPPTGGDYGPIFVADNMIVTPAVPVPEPGSVVLFAVGVLGLIFIRRQTQSHPTRVGSRTGTRDSDAMALANDTRTR